MNSLKQFVFDSILDDIINGVYPIDFVFNEKFLIEKYQISRSPIRDALIELCNEKILRSIPRFGYEIIRITEKDMRDITQFRVILELEAFKLTCRPHCDEIVEGIAAFNKETKTLLKNDMPNLRTMWQNNIHFHTMLISFIDNRYAEDTLKRALSMQYRAYSQLYWKKNMLAKPNDSFDLTINEYHYTLEKLLREHKFEEAVQVLKDDICDISAYFKGE
ncbi:MAG: GntR family transcriptional regulator [Clostridiales bacterium]|nr:GntR family transcriptional regulator [Clostridiales bacterium]